MMTTTRLRIYFFFFLLKSWFKIRKASNRNSTIYENRWQKNNKEGIYETNTKTET